MGRCMPSPRLELTSGRTYVSRNQNIQLPIQLFSTVSDASSALSFSKFSAHPNLLNSFCFHVNVSCITPQGSYVLLKF